MYVCMYVASFETFGSGSFGGPLGGSGGFWWSSWGSGGFGWSLGGRGGEGGGPPAREASVPAPQGPRRRAARRLELLVLQNTEYNTEHEYKYRIYSISTCAYYSKMINGM